MLHAKRVLAPVATPVLAVENAVPPPILVPTVPLTPDETGYDPPTPGLINAPETPQAGKCELDSSGAASSSAKAAKVTTSTIEGAPVLGQGVLASGSSQAMDESSRPEREPPELDSTPKAPKQMRSQVISFADMHEDMDPDLSTKAFGEEVIDSLESYDLKLDFDIEWDEENDESASANEMVTWEGN